MKLKFMLLCTLLLTFFHPASARADGIIIPEPPICHPCPPPPCPYPSPCPPPSQMIQLVIRYHKVNVTIKNQVAVTHVEQVFFNPNSWSVEGIYIFPLPVDAAVTAFTLWIDDKPIEGQVLDASQARQQYQQIVSSMHDPALLEYAGQGAVRAQIFPIPPLGERRIALEYTQALPAENGLVRYTYPLGTEKFSLWPLELVSISVDIESQVPIRAVYSPRHSVNVRRESNYHVQAGYEASQVLPDQDFGLFYSLGEEQAFHLLSYRDPTDTNNADGFFLLLLAPSLQTTENALPKDIIMILDRSGSMEGEKFRQAQDALEYILKHLNTEDRFNVIAFSNSLESFASQMQPVSETEQAIRWVESLNAQGSTDIYRALLEVASVADRERPTYIIFLTDGLPTEGVVDSQQIINGFQQAAPRNLRLFVFGVGYDVDTLLLDSIAQAHHGSSMYVVPGERLDETLTSFYARISTPVLTNLALEFSSLTTYDVYPQPLPDLFKGSQIIVVGRYRLGGTTTVSLTGMANDQVQTFNFPNQVFVSQSAGTEFEAFIPRLWATRKIGFLLNQIRLKGPDQETINQIVQLSIRYGIVTPYTSYLVSEHPPLGAAAQERIAAEQFSQMQSAPTAATSGQAAVQKAVEQGSMAEAQIPSAAETAQGTVRIVAGRAYLFDGQKWIDTAYDPETMKTIKIAFLSEEYFTLSQASHELAAAFSLGENVIAISAGNVYEVVQQGILFPSQTLLPTFAPTPLITTAAITTLSPSLTNPTLPPRLSEQPSKPEGSPFCTGSMLVPALLFVIIQILRAKCK